MCSFYVEIFYNKTYRLNLLFIYLFLYIHSASVVGISGIHLNVAPEKPTLCHDCGKSINESSHHSIDIKSPRNEKPDNATPSKTVKKAQKKFKESKNSTVSKEAEKASNEVNHLFFYLSYTAKYHEIRHIGTIDKCDLVSKIK